jgi:hypothetical protein
MRQDARRTARSMCDGEERLVGIETRSARVVFDKFLRELERNATLSNVVDRLRPVLLESESLTEAALKSALLPDEGAGKWS